MRLAEPGEIDAVSDTANSDTPGPEPTGDDLGRAIIATLTYSDLFDYPLTAQEITHYLIGSSASHAQVADALRGDGPLRGQVGELEGYYFLDGRAEIVGLRRRRRSESARLWRHARRYVRWLSRLPFVRMIAVSGALAMDNVGRNKDIDLMVVAAPGRVWIARRFMILAVRLARLFGDELCPNYLLAANALALAERDLFTAHELVQMLPLSGHETHQEMLRQNSWLAAQMPNAWRPVPPPDDKRDDPPARGARALTEGLLRMKVFDRWERAELRRMQARLRCADGRGEVAFSEHQCKGHVGLYRQQVLRRLEERLAAWEAGGRGQGAGDRVPTPYSPRHPGTRAQGD